MTPRSFALRTGFALLAVVSTASDAQTAPATRTACDASIAAHVAPGDRLRVTLRQLDAATPTRAVTGRFSSVDAGTLHLTTAARVSALPLANVERVQRARSAARLFWTTVAVVGATFAVTEAFNAHPQVVDGVVVGGLFVGVPAGALVALVWKTGATLCGP